MTETIISSSILILSILLLRKLLKGKVSSVLWYSVWSIVAIRLLFPFSINSWLPEPTSRLSVMNLVDDVVSVVPYQTSPMLNGIAEEGTNKLVNDYVKEDVANTNDSKNEADNLEMKKLNEEYADSTVIDWKLTFQIIWLGGIFLMTLWIMISNIHFSHYLKKNRKPLEGSNCKLPVFTVPELPSPCLCHYKGKVAIYLTAEMAEEPIRVKHILAHETSHYKHGDHIWSVLRVLLTAIYWFHPLVWVASIVSRHDSELACDETAIKNLGEEKRIEYGRTLVDMVTIKKAPKDIMHVATTMFSGKSSLKERVIRISNKPKTYLLGLLFLVSSLLFIVGCTFTGKENPNPSDFIKTDTAENENNKQVENQGHDIGKEENNPKEQIWNTAEEKKGELTREDVIELAQKGDDLRFSDFKGFKGGTEVGSGLLILRYPIEGEQFHLYIGGANEEEPPLYIILMANGAKTTIDIRHDKDGTSNYFEKYTGKWEPMICYDNDIYELLPDSKLDVDPSKLKRIGKIKGVVNSCVTPLENGYTNQDIMGASIYDLGNDDLGGYHKILVNYNGNYNIYYSMLGAPTKIKDVSYSGEDIEMAKQCVAQYFKKRDKKSKSQTIIKEIWFDEKQSVFGHESYFLYGKGRTNTTEPNDVIVLCCSFSFTGEKGVFDGEYPYWTVTMVRDGAKAKWKVVNAGV